LEISGSVLNRVPGISKDVTDAATAGVGVVDRVAEAVVVEGGVASVERQGIA
jgi:hypothetical protein